MDKHRSKHTDAIRRRILQKKMKLGKTGDNIGLYSEKYSFFIKSDAKLRNCEKLHQVEEQQMTASYRVDSVSHVGDEPSEDENSCREID